MPRQSAELTIVFADISGSSRLYEGLGDARARRVVAACIELLSEQTTRFGGRVVKTIGDEIMAVFPERANAVEATMAMQETITHDLQGRAPDAPASVAIRVGLHAGPVLVERGDVFGDAVNLAARMVGLAKAGQIITTRETANALPASLRAATRHLDRIAVKGKADEVDIYEVVWQADEVTRMAAGLVKRERPTMRLRLTHRGREVVLDHGSPAFVLGRGNKADMVINDSMASREHARIECRRGRFVLTDISTNGTYVLTDGGPSYLRREEIVLSGEGRIALGRRPGEATEVVTFATD
ncbi:MAG: FHA domain-containing protein [Ectothiorhodospiraceae bacterium]|nr:FHA domain-containing protein [Chromatiales bacterium]MCP5155670.1 FHA domain-containing protein [Ectothiorhodospiraceae bacterium]